MESRRAYFRFSKVLRWVPVVILTTAIFRGSTESGSVCQTSGFLEPLLRWLFPSIDGEMLGFAHIFIRKMGHVTVYGALAWAFWFALGGFSRLTLGVRTRWVLLLCALYAAGDEFHQSFYPSRGSSVYDVGLDLLGATLAVCLLRILWRWSASRTSTPPLNRPNAIHYSS